MIKRTSKLRSLALLAGLGLAMAQGSASAAVIVLDFEGVPDLSSVGNFYNGGAGTNYGVSFSGATLGLVDADAGGSGNFANEPSANTVMFFLNANNAILNLAAGFDTGFSFFYSSSTAATVNVYDGVDGTGNLLGSLNLLAQGFDSCSGDPARRLLQLDGRWRRVRRYRTIHRLRWYGQSDRFRRHHVRIGHRRQAATRTRMCPSRAHWACSASA